MTKTPRIAGNTLIKYLINKKMFSKQSVKGSHVTLKRDNVLVTVPAGNTKLKIGLLLGVLNKAGISKEEFSADYGKGLVK